MRLHFIGTGSNCPTVRRGVSATALQHDDGSVWLFDCGEGTQVQLQKSLVSCQKITDIFITHLHGDHLFGLPGLLCTKSSQTAQKEETNGKSQPSVVNIYGPEGINRFITTSLAVSHSLIEFQFRIHELIPEPEQQPDDWNEMEPDSNKSVLLPNQLPGNIIRATRDLQGNKSWLLRDDKLWCIEAGLVHHRVPTFGFIVKEKEKPGALKKDVLMALGIPPGPVYGQLKAGHTITTSDGRKVEPKDVLTCPIAGRIVAIIGDTRDASPLSHLIRGCDVVVHEATYDDSLKEKAKENGHSTPSQAVAFADSVGAKALLLNHYSQRYLPVSHENPKTNSVAVLENQAKEAAVDSLHVKCAEDLFVFDIPTKRKECLIPTDNMKISVENTEEKQQ